MNQTKWRNTARRWLKIFLRSIAGVFLLLLLFGGAGYWYLHPATEPRETVVYGERDGEPLTLEVVRPRGYVNGIGIAMMMSGSWKSRPDSFRKWLAAPLIRQGFTIFPIYHVSQPKAKVQETVEDVGRAIRYIRYHADEFGIDPDRIGVTGASSGGHLSLMLVTRGGEGIPESSDPVEKESGKVQAAAIFFPVTNLYNLGTSTENLGDGGPPKSYRKAFGPEAGELRVWKEIAHEISPVDHVHADQAPVLIFHGDADTLVPLEQSKWFQNESEKVGASVTIQERPGKGHGWLSMTADIVRCARWLETTLRSDADHSEQ